MNHYEISYISDPQLTDEQRGKLDASIDSAITNLKGTIEQSGESTRRRLAYEIDKKITGFLRLVNTELDWANIKKIHEMLKKEASVMRFTILATPRRTSAAAEVIEKYAKKKDNKRSDSKRGSQNSKSSKSTKKVTMEEVEKGIDEALTEEVK